MTTSQTTPTNHNAEITYAHISDPNGAFRFRQFEADPLPSWAIDVQPLIEAPTPTPSLSIDTPAPITRDWFSPEVELFANDPKGIFFTPEEIGEFLYNWYSGVLFDRNKFPAVVSPDGADRLRGTSLAGLICRVLDDHGITGDERIQAQLLVFQPLMMACPNLDSGHPGKIRSIAPAQVRPPGLRGPTLK